MIEARCPAKEKACAVVKRLTTCVRHASCAISHHCEACDELLCATCLREPGHAGHGVARLDAQGALGGEGGLQARLRAQAADWQSKLAEKKAEVDTVITQMTVGQAAVSHAEQVISAISNSSN